MSAISLCPWGISNWSKALKTTSTGASTSAQAAKQNFLGAWAEVDAPVLVIFNAFDQFEMPHGHKLIADTVNRLRPGSATYIERPGIGHSDDRYATIEDAYAFRDGTPAWREAADIMLNWLRGLNES